MEWVILSRVTVNVIAFIEDYIYPLPHQLGSECPLIQMVQKAFLYFPQSALSPNTTRQVPFSCPAVRHGCTNKFLHRIYKKC